MSSIGTGYDLSASQFSPDGRVFQVEYAQKAVENSGTIIGLRCKDGVVLAVEKLVTSKLYEPGANRRVFNIDKHIGMAVCGLISDARQLVENARSVAARWRSEYGSPIPIKVLNDRLSLYIHAYTLYSFVRPFGASVILSTWSEHEGPQLYMIDPSGVSFGFLGCAAGKAKQTAKTEVEKLNLENFKCSDLVKEAAKIIYLVHDEVKDKEFELELGWVCEATNGVHERVPDNVLAAAAQSAKDAMEASSESDEEM